MKFQSVPVLESAGLIAAHTVRTVDTVVRKGRPIGAEEAARLERAGVGELVAVRLDPGDVGEDAAAERLAQNLAGAGLRIDAPFTGRCNLFATQGGVLLVDAARIDAVNAIDEAITVATLAAFRPVIAGDMVATVKIIPYAVGEAPLERALAASGERALRVAPYRRRRVAVVSTLLPGLKPATVDKTLRVLADRLVPTGAEIVGETRVPHRATALSAALTRAVAEGADLVVVFGASAIADRRDVIPAGIEAAGGRVEHLGMPVDPGNLLLVGSLSIIPRSGPRFTEENDAKSRKPRQAFVGQPTNACLGEVPVIGAPGCARSPKENGFDWILHRLLAGLTVTRADIVRLGVGGLLTEIASRPQPRSGGESADDDG